MLLLLTARGLNLSVKVNLVTYLSCVLRGVFQSLVQKHFPSEKERREKGAGNKRKSRSSLTLMPLCVKHLEAVLCSARFFLKKAKGNVLEKHTE